MDHSESTPLLATTREHAHILSIKSCAENIHLHELSTLSKDRILSLCPSELRRNSAQQTAYALILLLHVRNSVTQPLQQSQNTWENWDRVRIGTSSLVTLDSCCMEIWNTYINNWRSDPELVETLAVRFPLDEAGRHDVALIDYFCTPATLDSLVLHPLMWKTITLLWSKGYHARNTHHTALARRITRNFIHFNIPRSLHAADLIARFVYLGCLGHIAMEDSPKLSLQAIYIISYSLLSLLREHNFLYLVTFVGFVFNLPGDPPGYSWTFTWVLWVLGLHTLQLFTPIAPSFVFFAWVPKVLPFSVFAWDGFRRTFVQPFWFCLPMFFIGLLALIIAPPLIPWFTSFSYPDKTGEASVDFLCAVLFLFVAFFIFSTVQFHHISLQADSWDRFSTERGLEARRRYVSTVARYSKPLYFPAPLNVVSVLLSDIPAFFGRTRERPIVFIMLEQIIWLVTILPLSFLASTLWLWGYF